jgi:hypothetical protein
MTIRRRRFFAFPFDKPLPVLDIPTPAYPFYCRQ